MPMKRIKRQSVKLFDQLVQRRNALNQSEGNSGMNINEQYSERKINISMGICILFFTFLLTFAGLLRTGMDSDWLTFLITISFVLWIITTRRAFFFKYFYFILMHFWMLFSVFYIENYNMWLPNLQKRSTYTGAFFPLAVSIFIFYFTLLLLEKRPKKFAQQGVDSLPDTKRQWMKLILVAALIIAAIFILDIANNNYYSSNASNRFSYLLSSNAFSISFYGYLQLLLPIIAIYAAATKKSVGMYIFLALNSAYLILIGNKFSALIQLFYIFVVSYLYPAQKGPMKKEYGKFLWFCALTLFILFSYSFYQMLHENGNMSSTVQWLQNRLFNGQGDVWWGIYNLIRRTGVHYQELWDELGAFQSSSVDQSHYYFGIYKLMWLIAPPSVVMSYASQHARFTASTQASFYYYFGTSGLVIGQMILAMLLHFVVNELIRACTARRVVDSVFYVWLVMQTMRIIFMSDFYLLCAKSTVFSVCVLTAGYLCRKHIQSREKIEIKDENQKQPSYIKILSNAHNSGTRQSGYFVRR